MYLSRNTADAPGVLKQPARFQNWCPNVSIANRRFPKRGTQRVKGATEETTSYKTNKAKITLKNAIKFGIK